ncbi:hypothetical protein DD829_22345 [Chryseobacterium sp. HMWF035]|nr:hypothetical protein DD829_22345 [Chryseobacterium sp. HMWF035]
MISCSTFNEVHYFKDGNKSNQIPNYYKVNVYGHTFLSSSRYMSGYFDKNAINLYFNEIKQPENAKFLNFNKADSIESGNELVLLLSSNSKAISNNLGMLSKNQTVLNSIGFILQKDKYGQNQQISYLNKDLNLQKTILTVTVDSYLKKIDEKSEKDQKKVIENLLSLLKKE